MSATVGLAAVAEKLRFLIRQRDRCLIRASFDPDAAECRAELRAAAVLLGEIDALINDLADADGADLSPCRDLPQKG